jgi:hypothetical protein
MLTRIPLLLFVFVLGLAAGRMIGNSRPQPAQRGSVVLPQVVTDLPGRVLPPQAGLAGKVSGVADRIRYRELTPERVYEAPRPVQVAPAVRNSTAPGQDTLVSERVHRDPDQTPDLFGQVSKRGERLSVYVHGDSSDFRFDFRLPSADADFDAVAGTTSRPLVRTPRCLLCAPRLSVEGGMLWADVSGEPYGAAEASVAALSRTIRVVGRAEFTASDGRLYTGVRYTF